MAEIDPGPIVLPSDVELAVRDTLQEWVPFYLADIDRQQQRAAGTTRPPRTWDIASDGERWMEETPPALLVACPGTVGDPALEGPDGHYSAVYQVNVGVTAGGATEQGTRALAGRYAGAIIYTLGQQGDMGGLADATWWRGVRTDVIARQRTLMATEVLAHVRIARVIATRGPHLPQTRPVDPTDPPLPSRTPSGLRVRVTPR